MVSSVSEELHLERALGKVLSYNLFWWYLYRVRQGQRVRVGGLDQQGPRVIALDSPFRLCHLYHYWLVN